MKSITLNDVRKAADLGYPVNVNITGEKFKLAADPAPDASKFIPVKWWYMSIYPSDDLGLYLRDDVNFNDVFDNLGRVDFYKLIGSGDSIVRERIFSRVALLFGVDYGVVYKKWMEGV